MDQLFYEGETFSNLISSGREMKDLTYEECSFVNCDFSDGILSFNKYLDCTFTNCNLSMTKLISCQFKNVIFKACKLLGINFSDCSDSLFSVGFEGSLLDYCSFSKKRMLKTSFINSSLKGADFTECDLTGSLFTNCDLDNTVFNKTTLKEVDLLTAINFIIDPENNNIRRAKFSLSGLAGLLNKYDLILE